MDDNRIGDGFTEGELIWLNLDDDAFYKIEALCEKYNNGVFRNKPEETLKILKDRDTYKPTKLRRRRIENAKERIQTNRRA